MDGLFNKPSGNNFERLPLAVRMRPRSLDEFVGQSHILGEGKILRRIIESDNIPSLIFYGPPGCGKTALAMIIANRTKNYFHHLNAVTSTVSDVREIISIARERKLQNGKSTILFLDEIAHFNKLQQDALMKDTEEGTIILIGATTHNPSFYINNPLLSRAMVFQFEPLSEEEIKKILIKALKDKERGMGKYNVKMSEEALSYIAKMSNGDARKALNSLEIGILTSSPDKDGYINFDIKLAQESIHKFLPYDREDFHYDTISAFIKSMRGSDPDAALYYLAKMIVSGEDPRFIARRIVICAAEDVGNADPMALVVAVSAFHAVEFVGMPEAKIPLAQATIYVATAPKSNSAYKGIENAIEEVKKEGAKPIPKHLQQAGYKLAEKFGKGAGYLYPHDFPGHYVPQKYMEEEKRCYFPSDQGYEKKIKEFLENIEKLKKEYEKKDKKGNSRIEEEP
ncbi:MAG: replication-associated recombination protein A [Candidatus Omnitrophota bacterium]|nr:MAG: replication-associated recombination protein A [Candidatus Omnitrophota bacterium]